MSDEGHHVGTVQWSRTEAFPARIIALAPLNQEVLIDEKDGIYFVNGSTAS